MARRENQSLVIALIVMVMLVVVLSISTYFFWNSSQKKIKEVATSKAAATSAQQASRKAVDETLRLKQLLGYDADAPITTIEEGYASDMELFGGSIPEGERNYRKLPGQLVAVIQDRNQQIAALVASESKWKSDTGTIRTEEQGRVTEAQTGQQAAAGDLATERKSYQDSIEQLTQKVSLIQTSCEQTVKRVNSEKATSEKQLAILQQDYDKLRSKHSLLEEKIRKLQNVSFERPDGKITYVNQGSRSVYLNIGRADMLQRQTTFSVYDVGESDMARIEPKGKIEITRIMGDHLSEGRILDDSVSNPILTGDVVYSPVWEAGRPIHFALAGFLDADRDGRGDNELVRNLISRNGGVIDAQVTESGEREGNIGIETRFLVIGKRPTEKSDTRGLREFSRIRSEAESYGITEISLERFLTDMGYQAVGKTIKLGRNARPADFPPEKVHQTNGRFRPRTPPKTKTFN